MKHELTVTLNNGTEYICPGVDTVTLAGMLTMLENPHAQTSMMPLDWTDAPGPQRRLKYNQAHVKVGHVSSVHARPSLWVGVRSMFLQVKSVWEVDGDALGTGIPVIPTLVRVEEIADGYVTMNVVSPTLPGNGLQSPGKVSVDAFIEVTTPVSVDRLMDHGVVLNSDDVIGRWPTDAEMREALTS